MDHSNTAHSDLGMKSLGEFTANLCPPFVTLIADIYYMVFLYKRTKQEMEKLTFGEERENIKRNKSFLKKVCNEV